MKITVAHGRCQGHAMCHNAAPDLFELDDYGYNRMAPFTVAEADQARTMRAIRMCPERAITIVRDPEAE
jgi:ferredoxin